jgi:hypothetical protein
VHRLPSDLKVLLLPALKALAPPGFILWFAIMNWSEFKKNKGSLVKLAPSACHLNDFGEPILPAPDESWTLTSFEASRVLISAPSGHSIYLDKDHIVNSVPAAAKPGSQAGDPDFLRLMVQIFIAGDGIWLKPNSKPGAPVDPPMDLSTKARGVASADLARATRRQVQILDRIIVNYSQFLHDRLPHGLDTWASLRPSNSSLHLTVPSELSASDASQLAEFHSSLREVDDLLQALIGTQETQDNYNIWNVLMHRAQHSVRVGSDLVRRFCPSREYDVSSPASGTLLSQAERVLTASDALRANALGMPNLAQRLTKLGALGNVSPPVRPESTSRQ